MSPVRGIPTSRAYWELKAEQVLNRVFDPEKPIEVEVCDTPASASADAFQAGTTIPVELHDLPPAAAPIPQSASGQSGSRRSGSRPISRSGPGPVKRWVDQLGRQPSLLLAGASLAVMGVAGTALVVLGIWNQSQQAIRQERNMLLIERLRTMGPSAAAGNPDPAQAASASTQATQDGELPPPPPGEPWMEELASLPTGSAPAADVLKVPVNSRITNPAPAASGPASWPGNSNGGGSTSGGGGGNAPQLVGVVQVPGQSGSAIFQIGGSSTSAAVGESIGSTGWRLRSASGDTAVIEKGGEQRRVSISSGF